MIQITKQLFPSMSFCFINFVANSVWQGVF